MDKMKFLISALGNPKKEGQVNQYNYENTDYKFIDENEMIPYSTPFLFEAILHHYQDKEENIDHLILIGTAKSCWQDVYNYCCAQCVREDGNSQILTDKEIAYYLAIDERAKELNSRSSIKEVQEFERFLHPVEEKIEELFGKKHKLKVHIFLTQYGITEEEAFYNYQRLRQIEEFMPDGEEQDVLLDITHSFRYMPIYHFLVMNYLMQLSKKKVNVSAVYYGMYELKREENLSYAPVLNMRYLISTLKWINSVNEVNSYGSVYHMKESLDKERERAGRKEGTKKETELTDWLEIFEWSANTNNFNALTRSIEEITHGTKEDIYSKLGQDAVEKISDEFAEQFLPSKKWEIAFEQLRLSQWFFEQRRFGLAAITIQECVKSYAVYTLMTKEEQESKKEGIFDNDLRNTAIGRLKKLSEKNSDCKELFNRYWAGKDMRNTMAHSLNTLKVEDKKSGEILSKINADRNKLKAYIKFVQKALDKKILENKDPNSLKKSSQDHYGRIVCIAKKKKEWEWKNLLTRENLKKDDIGFINLSGFEKDYQTKDQIEEECKEIFKRLEQECDKCTDRKSLVLIGNTNMEKQVYLIKEIQNRKKFSDRCVVKMLSESKQKLENKIVVQDKNIPYESKNTTKKEE